MNSSRKIFLLCPVPEDQKPINEYLQLKTTFFGKKDRLSFHIYEEKLVFFFFLFFSFLTFLEGNELKHKAINLVVENLLVSILFLLSIVFANLFRWREVNKKFLNPRLFYEEGSWYDGEIWEKPFLLIKNDKLLSIQTIQPILQKLLFLFFLLAFSLCFLFSLKSIYVSI